MTSRIIDTGDAQIDCLVSGPKSGPLAILLHGFPDTRHTWRHLAPVLAERGYRVVVPALRGYAPSSLSSTGNYQLAAATHDAIVIHDAFDGGDDAVLIGHDWGAAITHIALASTPERWRIGVGMSVPPPQALATMFTSYAQLSMSWYMFFFQLPLADFVVPMDDYKFLDTMWRSWSPGYEPSEDLAKVKEAIGAPENFQAAIGYYRAMFDDAPADPAHAHFFERRFDRPSVPTLYLHGIDDGCVGIHNIGDPSPFLAEGSRVEFINLAGHFLHLEQPEIVNAHIADWLGA